MLTLFEVAIFAFLTLNLTPISFGISPEQVFGSDNAEVNTEPIVNSPDLVVQKVVDGLRLPTSMAFLGPNDILVLEKNNGTVQRIVNGTMLPKPVLDVNVSAMAERGMLGIAVAKQDNNGTAATTYVFLYYTEASTADGEDVSGDSNSNGTTTTREPLGNRLYRYEFVNGQLVNPELILDLPTGPGGTHNGGAIVAGPDNNSIYLPIGNVNGSRTMAQNFRNAPEPNGTSGILRAGVSNNNNSSQEPILGTGGLLEYYYAYGIRNSFGIDFDPVTGKLWDTENGPTHGDEINLVEPGFNSGWNKILGMSSADSRWNRLVDFGGRGNYSDPEFVWNNTVGPTAIVFLDSAKLGKTYENDMFVGDIEHGNLYHFELNGTRNGFVLNGSLADKVADTASKEELAQILFGEGFLGITDIEVGPDGYLYVVSFGGGAIYRIVPGENNMVADGNNTEFDYKDLIS